MCASFFQLVCQVSFLITVCKIKQKSSCIAMKYLSVLSLVVAIGVSVSGTDTTANENPCTHPGFFPLSVDSADYYGCYANKYGGLTKKYLSCPNGQIFLKKQGYCGPRALALIDEENAVSGGRNDSPEVENPTVPTLPTQAVENPTVPTQPSETTEEGNVENPTIPTAATTKKPEVVETESTEKPEDNETTTVKPEETTEGSEESTTESDGTTTEETTTEGSGHDSTITTESDVPTEGTESPEESTTDNSENDTTTTETPEETTEDAESTEKPDEPEPTTSPVPEETDSTEKPQEPITDEPIETEPTTAAPVDNTDSTPAPEETTEDTTSAEDTTTEEPANTEPTETTQHPETDETTVEDSTTPKDDETTTEGDDTTTDIPEETTTPETPNHEFFCPTNGFFPQDGSCDKFNYCAEINGEMKAFQRRCPDGQNYNPIGGFCTASYNCDSIVRSNAPSGFECLVEGTFVYHNDCSRYHKCLWDQRTQEFKSQVIQCPQGKVYHILTGRCDVEGALTCLGRPLHSKFRG